MAHLATTRLLEELTSTITLIDVGARWGVVSPWNEFGSKGRIICFEADAEECERLNKLKDNEATIYVPLALADHDRGVTLNITDGVGCSSIYLPKRILYNEYPGLAIMRPIRTVTCPSTTLDHYCEQNHITSIDAMKLDTQGSELDVLKAATGILETVSLIDIEVEFNELYEGQPLFCDVDGFLRSRGFVLWRINNLAHYSNGLVEGANSGILIASEPGSFQTIEQDNGQLFWAQAHYVRREFVPTEPEAELETEQALKAAILVGQYGHWDLSLEILRKCGDPKLFGLLESMIKPCDPQMPVSDQLTRAHAEIAELRQKNAELQASHAKQVEESLRWFEATVGGGSGVALSSGRAGGAQERHSKPIWRSMWRLRHRKTAIALARQAARQKKWELAVRHYRDAVDQAPRSAALWLQYGHALKEAGKLETSERAYRHALECDNRMADTYLQLGHLLGLQNRHIEAGESYIRALRLAPRLQEALHSLQALGWASDDIDRAVHQPSSEVLAGSKNEHNVA
jgi:FkbM family methyltransferase